MRRAVTRSAILAAAALAPARVFAQVDVQPATETSAFLFNTILHLGAGAAVLLTVAGLGFREAGLVRAKNAASACVKMLVAPAIAVLAFWLAGSGLLNDVEAGGLLGALVMWGPDDGSAVERGFASGAEFVRQMGFAAVAALIVSGAVAERMRLWSYFIFTAFLAAVLFPIAASWDWGGGYLEATFRYVDYGGAMLAHGLGGAAALAAALVVGPRLGRFARDEDETIHGSNLTLTALGALFLWAGLTAILCASRLSLDTVADAIDASDIAVKASLAAASGVVAATILTQFVFRKLDLVTIANGAVGGLVSISADPLSPLVWQAAVIGAFGGVIVAVGAPALARLRIDDVAGVVPAHLFCGVWSVFIVPWANHQASIVGQMAGAGLVLLFALAMSFLFLLVLKYTAGVRIAPEEEHAGLDPIAVGRAAYLAED